MGVRSPTWPGAFVTVVSAAFSGLLASSGLTPAQVREKLIADRPLWSAEIYRRAHERGEIDLDRIPRIVLSIRLLGRWRRARS